MENICIVGVFGWLAGRWGGSDRHLALGCSLLHTRVYLIIMEFYIASSGIDIDVEFVVGSIDVHGYKELCAICWSL